MKAAPVDFVKNFLKIGKLVPLFALPLLLTPQFAFAASSGLAQQAANPFVLLNTNVLQYLVNNTNFGVGILAYAALIKTITYYPIEWLMTRLNIDYNNGDRSAKIF